MKVSTHPIYQPRLKRHPPCAMVNIPVSAGYPFATDTFIEGQLDPYEYLVKHPSSTFFVHVTGDSMVCEGADNISPGDLLVVDRTLEPRHGKPVIAILDGELTVKKFERSGPRLCLVPANEQYQPIEIMPHQDFEIWGVVTFVIHRV